MDASPIQLCIPSVVLAEANWYGSIRAGWQSHGDKKGIENFGSRWGISGSSEAAEGLTAVYKFETRIADGEPAQSTNQRYVGLSGGFGNITLGKLNNASANHVGFVDQAYWLGSWEGMVDNKVGNSLSYAVDVGAASFQLDAIADSSKTSKDLDSSQFGATLKIGDNGKIGFAYINHPTTGAPTPGYAADATYTNNGESKKARDDAYYKSLQDAIESSDLSNIMYRLLFDVRQHAK
ncbi:MAG: porin [Acidiferrobacterales bacterium]|nr:porin [Acidiferrobacterales bacterium]